MTKPQSLSGAFAKIEGHEELCAERYASIHATLGEMKGDASDMRKLLWAILVSVAGFALITLVAIVLHALRLT